MCAAAFIKAHNRGHTYYDRAIKKLKKGDKNSTLFKNHCAVSHKTAMQLFKKGGHFGLKLSAAQLTQMSLPNTSEALITAAWLEKYFTYAGKINI